ncbi:MAG: hypothetical protein WCX62_01795 [Synergistaceae bacterium]
MRNGFKELPSSDFSCPVMDPYPKPVFALTIVICFSRRQSSFEVENPGAVYALPLRFAFLQT